MPKKKVPAPTRKKSPQSATKKKQVVPKKPPPARTTRARQAKRTNEYSAEYLDYLERYKIAGGDRPFLSPKEFDRLDDELLDLLALDLEVGLDDEQLVRLQELEYLLLESEQ